MDVRDGDISRLDQALGIARDLVGTSGGIRLGTALGKGKGVLAVPLTYDTGAVLTFLEGLTGSSLTGRGTNLETLLDAASGAFQNTLPTRRVIILFSDGESLSGSLAAAIDRAMDSGITMTAVGMGTEAGGLVPQEADPLSLDGALRDEAEALLMSYRRGDVLRDAAERTGGIYVDGNRNDAAGLLADYIRSLAPESGVNGYHLENSPQWRFFVIAALLFLGVSKLFEKRPRKRRR
jgi:Ca-activated chloride channel family protein